MNSLDPSGHAFHTAPAGLQFARGQSESGLDLRDILQILWGARWTIGVCMLLGAAIAFAAVKQITPQYRAEASIMLDIRQQNVIDLESVLSETPLNRQLLESELLVIESDPLLERVVDKLRLDLDPEYNPRMAQPTEMARLLDEKKAALMAFLGVGPLIDALTGGDGPGRDDGAAPSTIGNPADAAGEPRRQAVRTLRGKLTAVQLSPAYAIKVVVTSSDRVKAALIANAVADQYVSDQLDAKFTAVRRATTWLTGRLAQLRARVESSGAALQSYTTENQTGSSQGASITQQQIAQLNSALIGAKAEVAQARATYEQAERMVGSLGAYGAASSLTSPLLASLRGQRADLTRRATELSNRYGPKHPTMVEVRSEIRDVDGAIAGEVRQIINGLENDMRVAQARVEAFTGGLAELEVKASGQSEASVGLGQLEAEAEANRRIYDNFLERLNETREQEGFQTADSRVIEPASAPYAPFMPRTKVTTALGGIAGGAFGLGFVILMRLLDRSARTAASISDRTGLPVLASIPMLRRRYRRSLLTYLKDRPNSELAESVRYLRNALLASGGGVQSALITSSLPEEGKMTLTVLLAEMTARMDKSVIVIDGDLRRPKIAKALAIRPENDLVTFLDGDCALEDAIYRADNASFDTLPLHAGQGARSDLLASPRMKALVAMLNGRYDMVLIEGPPVLGVGDFSVLGRIVDTSIVAVEWNKTPVAAVERAVHWLADHQVHVFGAVLTKVDRRRAATFDSASYGADYSVLRRYYLN